MTRPTHLLRSPWSDPHAVRRPAIDFHIEQLAVWLRRAGAEPRLALILCAGKGAKRRLAEGLALQGVKVQPAPSTPARPLPAAVLAHQGDHFNDVLYWVDGFADQDPAPQLEVLEGQRKALRRTATWVGLVIENLRALERLATFAPRLFASFERRALILAAGAPDEPRPPEALVATWRAAHQVPELVFTESLAATRPPEAYDDFARLVRSGYAANLLGQAVHPERAALLELWQRGAPLSSAPGPVLAAGLARHGPPEALPAARAALGGDPLSLVAAGEAQGLPGGYAALARLQAAPEDPAALAAGAAAAAEAPPALAAALWLAVAEGEASRGALEPTQAALEAARAQAEAEGSPELAFEAVAAHARLLTLLGQRGPGQRAIERLADHALRAASPWLVGRHLAERAAFTEPLDRRRAGLDYAAAEAHFAGHGWSAERARAQAGQERCR